MDFSPRSFSFPSLRSLVPALATLALVISSPSFGHGSGSKKADSKSGHGHGHSHGKKDAKKKKKRPPSPPSKYDEVISFDAYRQPSGIIDLLTVRNIPGQGTVLYHNRSTNDGKSFSPKISIASRLKMGEDFVEPRPPKRGGDWNVAAVGDTIMISYEKMERKNSRGSGPIRTLVSTDGGISFAHSKNLSDTDQGQTFVDAAATENGDFHFVWLESYPDGRGMRHGKIDLDSDSLYSEAKYVDKKTCACCYNTLKSYGNSLYAIYRDKKPSDMHMAYSHDNGKTWKDGGFVGNFNWDFAGCPHVGSGLTFDPKSQPPGGVGSLSRPFAHATAWTAMQGKLGLYYQNWDGQSTKWSKPYKLAELGRRSDIAMYEDLVVAVYEEMIEEVNVARIRVADVTKSPITFSPPRTISSKFTTYPRLEGTKDGVIMFSTQKFGDSKELVIDRISADFLKKLVKSTPKMKTAKVSKKAKPKL